MNFFKAKLDQIIVIIQRAMKDPLNAQAVGLWSAAFITGLIAVEYAKIFKFLEVQLLLINESHPYWIFIIAPTALVLGWYLVRRWAPEAGGSGIPQIMAANDLNYSKDKASVDQLLSPRVAVVKIFSSLLAIAGGGAIGREGPTLQISACVFHFFGRQVRKVYPKADSHTWIIAGAAAGLASAFNTPLGGIVYAIEEMGTMHFQRVKTPLFTSVIIAGLVSQWLLGSYLYLGFPTLTEISFDFIPYSFLTGILTGGLGALFGMGLARAVKWKSRFATYRSQFLIAAASGLVMAGLIWLSQQSAGSGSEVISELLFHGQIASPSIVAYRFFATAVSYLSGSAGGIFSPSLAVGATFGSWLESLFSSGHPHLMVLLGMIGFLTGVTRTPFTSFILVLEMTDRHLAIFPMMVCALSASGIASLIEKEGFYHVMKERYLHNLTTPPPPPS